jgi:hypothetical protein
MMGGGPSLCTPEFNRRSCATKLQKFFKNNTKDWVYLLSLDSACKLLNLLQLLGSLQHVCHMLRGLKSNIWLSTFQVGLRVRIRIILGAGSGSTLEWKSGNGSECKSNFRSFSGSNWIYGGTWTLTMEAWRFKMESWMVNRPVIADSHHCDEDHDPDTDPHLSKN